MNFSGIKCVIVLGIGSVFAWNDAPAQSARLPLPVENPAPVLDQFQRPLDKNAGYLVHVLKVGDGVRAPDPSTGMPHDSNAVIFTSCIGAGVSPRKTTGGFFMSLIPRPSEPFFVRVYNSATLRGATFYTDSEIFYPSDAQDIGFYPALAATTNPVDASIAADGLTVSMKRSLGLDPGKADTDGDGYSDLDELAMGTDATRADEFMPEVEMSIRGNGVVSAAWSASPNPNARVLSALGLPPHTEAKLDELFGNVPYQVQYSRDAGLIWSNVIEGEIGGAGWPPVFAHGNSSNKVHLFRMLMRP